MTSFFFFKKKTSETAVFDHFGGNKQEFFHNISFCHFSSDAFQLEVMPEKLKVEKLKNDLLNDLRVEKESLKKSYNLFVPI